MSSENGNILDFGSIDFTPDWAKKDAGVNLGKVRPPREDRQGGGDFRGGKRFDGGKKAFGDRKPLARKPFERRERPEARPQPLSADVKVLPETKALGTIIRKLQGDVHAYKLKDLAYFFLDNPSSVLLKITPKGGEKFCQCKACGFASTNEDDVVGHAMSAHLADYYDAKEIECEPPKGNFNCVAKCGLSGELLGPPNIHEFGAVVREMIRTRYPQMSETQYRAHLEMVRDPEAIEQWRQSAVKKTVYFAKGAAEQEGAAGIGREQAEGEFRRNILASLIDRPKHLMITAEMAMKSPVRPLQWAANDALAAERKAPYGMCFALRGAFHHRKLKFFRANDARGPEFVAGVEYKPFDVEHAIPELATAARFVAEHPCCDKSEFPAEGDFEKYLSWLVTTGHVVAFTNGVFSAVEKYPKYGPQWKKRPAPAKSAAPETASAPAEIPAAEVSPSPDAEAAEPVSAPEAAPEPDAKAEPESKEPLAVESAEAAMISEEKKDETAPVVAE